MNVILAANSKDMSKSRRKIRWGDAHIKPFHVHGFP